jgi:hypothetical protein
MNYLEDTTLVQYEKTKEKPEEPKEKSVEVYMRKCYYSAFYIMMLNHVQRKKKYYEKNSIKIICRFVYNYVKPYIASKKKKQMFGKLQLLIGWNYNTNMLNWRDEPYLTVIFDIYSLRKIEIVTLKSIPFSRQKELRKFNVNNIVSGVNKIKDVLQLSMSKCENNNRLNQFVFCDSIGIFCDEKIIDYPIKYLFIDIIKNIIRYSLP